MPRFYLDTRDLIIAIALTAVASLAWLVFANRYISEQVVAETQQELNTLLAQKMSLLRQSITDSSRHLRFFSDLPVVQTLVDNSDLNAVNAVDAERYQAAVANLQTLFQAYLQSNPDIAQLRVIAFAGSGPELVRVDSGNGDVRIVSGENLQAKGDRDYMLEARSLTADEEYVSSINLNREYGLVDDPPWPTFRVAQPLFDANDNLFGVLIANFRAQPLLDELQSNLNSRVQVYLINSDGNFLVHPQPENAFAFEYGPAPTWRDRYTTANDKNSSYLIDKGTNNRSLYLADALTFASTSSQHQLQIFVAISEDLISGVIRKRSTTAILGAIIFFIVVTTLLTFYWQFSVKSRVAMEANARYEAIVRDSNDAIISMNDDGLIESWNAAAKLIFGVNESEAIGSHFTDFISQEEDKNKWAKKLSSISSGGMGETFDLNAVRKPQQSIIVSVVLSAIKIAGIDVGKVGAVIRDISKERLIQHYLKSLNKELQTKNEEMEQFIYTVSHDLKSPLITINSFVKSVVDSSENQLNEQGQRRLQRVLVNVEHMGQLLADLLQISRLVREEVSPETCKVGECVEAARGLLEGLISSTGAVINVDDNLATVSAHKSMLITCLQNLLSNAIAYVGKGKQPNIHISTLVREDEVGISVRDNGIGIDEKHFSKIFRIFERLGNGEGNGVGLAIVQTAMRKHGGRVELVSTLGKGSTFTLVFPKASAIPVVNIPSFDDAEAP